MAISEAQKKYEKKRSKNCKTYAIKYNLINETEHEENNRLSMYLKQTRQSANSYIKALIKADLDSKGFSMDTDMDTMDDDIDV